MEPEPPADPSGLAASPSYPSGWRRWLARGAFESALIVFSVVLALGVTDWAERRRTEREVSDLKRFFVEEIQANRAVLASSRMLPHHRRLLDVFEQTASLNRPTAAQAREAYGAVFETGIHVPNLRDAVWRSAATSGLLDDMRVEEVFVLADVYASQSRLMETSLSFAPTVPGLLQSLESDRTAPTAVVAGQLHLGDVVAGEESLVRLYDRALAELQDQSPGDAATRMSDAGERRG